MTDHDTGGTLDGWEDELDDWTEAVRNETRAAVERLQRFDDLEKATDAAIKADKLLEAVGIARNLCIRPTPPGFVQCTQGYDHTGRCDWAATSYGYVSTTLAFGPTTVNGTDVPGHVTVRLQARDQETS